MHIATDQGYFVSEQHQRVAQIVNDFDRNLEVQWIPPDQRSTLTEQAKPFRIVHNGSGKAEGQAYVVMDLAEAEMNGSVIERLFQSRVDKHDIPAQIKAQHDARRLVRLKELEDEQAATRDFDAFRLKTPLHTFKHEGKTYRQ